VIVAPGSGEGDWIYDERERQILGAPRTIGPTARIGLSLACRWRPRDVFVTVNVYIDESGTHGQSAFMILAGWVGTLGQWNHFDIRWRRLLRRNRIAYFHAKELESRQKEYKGWTDAQAEKLVRDCVRFTDEHAAFGFAVRISQNDYHEYYRNDGVLPKMQPDSMYGLAFRFGAAFVPDMTRKLLNRNDFTLNHIVEDGHPNAGSCHEIIKSLKKLNAPQFSEHLGTVTLADGDDFPGLQAADGLAYGAWANDEELLPHLVDFERTASPEVIRRGTIMRAPIFRCDATPEVLSLLRSDRLTLAAMRQQFGERKPRPKSDANVPPSNPASAEQGQLAPEALPPA
jgi:hypothetical protein